ncbi:RsiV family protein [Acinetobacter sp. LH3_13]|uniref:RsiV family protein n=1 Tax=Acinetobacter sp. LH3_13 TaxID=3434463 RepID=UPI003EB6C558
MLKNKSILAISILITTLGITACQPKKTEPEAVEPEQTQTEQQSLKLVGDTEKLNLSLPKCDGKNCPEISIERLNSNQAFIDQFIDQKIIQELAQILEIAPQQAVSEAAAIENAATAADAPTSNPTAAAIAQVETLAQKLEKQTLPYVQSFLALDQELKALSSNHKISLMIKPKILNADQPLATVVLNSSSYLGGAHGSSAQQYYNFDLEKKKLVLLNDILLDKQRPQLERKAYEAFKQWVIASELSTNVQEYEQAWKFKLSENYYLGQQGLILQYAEYEIGPYVAGLPRLTIPYAELQGILKAAYLPVTEAASEATAKSTEASAANATTKAKS